MHAYIVNYALEVGVSRVFISGHIKQNYLNTNIVKTYGII